MTQRQANFAKEFIKTGNASEAYRRAYPRSKGWSDKAVHTRASLLLSLADVSRRVEELRARAESEAVATRQEVLEMLTRVVRAVPAGLLCENGTVDLSRLREMRQELQEFTVEETRAGGLRHKVRFRDPIAAAERIAKLQGWDKPQEIKLSGSVGVDRDALREMFRTMTREERREWLQSQLSESCGPSAADA